MSSITIEQVSKGRHKLSGGSLPAGESLEFSGTAAGLASVLSRFLENQDIPSMRSNGKTVPVPKPKRRKHRRPWTEADFALLGTNTDKTVAKKLKRNQSQVTQMRIKKGISAFGKRVAEAATV